MSRRVSLIVLLGLILIMVLSFGVSASAEPQNDGDSNNEEATIAQSELLLNQNIADTVLKQADTEEGLKKAQASLEKQAVTVYKAGPLYLLDFLLSAESFSDFANRLWFSIKALLGMADEVQDWRNQSHELEQIATDLKAKKDTLQPAVDDAQVQKDAAQENANQLQNAIEDAKNSLPQDSGGSPAQGLGDSPTQGLGDSPTQGLGDSRAQGLGNSPTQGLGNSPTQGLGNSPAQLAPFERTVNDIHNLPAPDDAAVEPNQPVTSNAPQQLSPEIAKGLGVSQDQLSGVQDAADKTVQSGQAANAAEKDKSNAVSHLAPEVANLDPQLPTGGQPGGATRGAPLSQQDSQIPKLVDDFRAAKNKANDAEQNAKKQAGDLPDTLGRALQPATGNQTTPG